MDNVVICMYAILKDGSLTTSIDGYKTIIFKALPEQDSILKMGYCKVDRIDRKIEFLGDDIGMGYGKISEQDITQCLKSKKAPDWLDSLTIYYKYLGMSREMIDKWKTVKKI